MVIITRNIKKLYPKAFAAARKCKFRIVFLRDNLIYCARKQKGHGDYLIRISAIPSVHGGPQIKMECKTIDNKPCDGIYYHGCCAHIAATVLRIQAKPNKKQQSSPVAA